ncbi:MAG TPA: UPF0489 family protein [Thermodesulfobacteriota bacterium]|nr:UPF0489 family protein [Thermodesulfobacteriota bacterium]
MISQEFKRKLAAILSANVKNYSKQWQRAGISLVVAVIVVTATVMIYISPALHAEVTPKEKIVVPQPEKIPGVVPPSAKVTPRTNIYIIKQHYEVFHLWQSRGVRNIRLVHVDFHDDLGQLLVDRRRGKAFRTGSIRDNDNPLDEGNFLTHAVFEGMVREITWIRGRVAGREYDSVDTVLYESDWSAIRYRLAHAIRRGREVPLIFKEIIYEEWDGIVGNAYLDIDWDFFASVKLSPKGLSKRFDEFLDRIGSAEPPEIYLCYSPEYVHPSQEEFRYAIKQLSKRYACIPLWTNPKFLDNLPVTKPQK